MNIFQFIADMTHLAAVLILLLKIKSTRNCLGLSIKTQELYVIVFCSRYVDLFVYKVSLYNTCMKIAFIGSALFIVYVMRYKRPYCSTYDASVDSFPHFKYLVPGAFLLALCINNGFTLWDINWSFSIWLEALAIFPQLEVIRKLREIENITSHYIGALGAYRACYILNWIYKYVTYGSFSFVSIIAGIVQTLLYVDFFYYYFKSMKEGRKSVSLPL